MMPGHTRITKWAFYVRGGLTNKRLARRMRQGRWCYYQEIA